MAAGLFHSDWRTHKEANGTLLKWGIVIPKPTPRQETNSFSIVRTVPLNTFSATVPRTFSWASCLIERRDNLTDFVMYFYIMPLYLKRKSDVLGNVYVYLAFSL